MIIDRISSWNYLIRCILGVEAREVENPNRRMEMAYIIKMYESSNLVLDETRPSIIYYYVPKLLTIFLSKKKKVVNYINLFSFQ